MNATMFARYYDVRYVWSVGTDHDRPGSCRVYADSAAAASKLVRTKLKHADSVQIHAVLPVS
jgi:hypothetical protein